MTTEELDILWSSALSESVAAGEMYTRYRFAALVLEEAAKAAETQLDEAYEARADKAFKDADFVGNPNDALSKGKHWMTVSTCNAVARNCVNAIRSLKPKVEA